jgi:serine/threonine protein kinase
VDGQLVMVSELADRTLLERFEECRAEGGTGIPRDELLRYLFDAADALDFIAVQFRLQHLDIKPTNLFLMGGRLKIGDFGLLREICHRRGTSAGGLSPAYAAPESFTGGFSLYSDQYALAIVYQEMLTGVRPFRGRTAQQLGEQHLRSRANLASLFADEQVVIERALAKDPNERYPSCGEMVRALASVVVTALPVSDRVDSDAELDSPYRCSPSLGPIFRSLNIGDSDLESSSVRTIESRLRDDSSGSDSSEQHLFPANRLPDGLPEPTLFLGLGGIGGRILTQLRSLFETRVEHRAARRSLGWLLLDTDRAAIPIEQRSRRSLRTSWRDGSDPKKRS